MPLFQWKCDKCGEQTRKLLSSRPLLHSCCCGGKLNFLTNVASQTMEVIDNGLMAKALERPVNIEERLAERTALAEKPDDDIV